ncbi:hypothetical protein SCATT_30000 [Streptantibioticus cattleyicolor NRRL 8057 = DSM 46488]|uniref:DNA primase/polymerase bifunctional N-terminal domain-containing protein n=1 Tax=Streptantibioticus cattleyicolor (strain ATCC 35852 / DSM 46488 / JCM 4925 / NBRC 14057 / NRRL 8057) TaxID=1003195 RepID=G8WU74_STREN|nr:bifunctional DNA primase/polymerase [Streptantibioticus cattleyicolor]AEW95371.1 hypothetical protein SCATT_30000 [Streptantibioticus cattleyicolor NRRL 8057 = DSM 46488]
MLPGAGPADPASRRRTQAVAGADVLLAGWSEAHGILPADHGEPSPSARSEDALPGSGGLGALARRALTAWRPALRALRRGADGRTGRASAAPHRGVGAYEEAHAPGSADASGRTAADSGASGSGCACPRPDCAVPGAHPYDPGLLAATTDARMVDWWWERRPEAPVLLATGEQVSAVSLPAAAGVRALAALDRLGVRLGPVVATPTRCVLLVAPYSFEELGELLNRHDWVPSSLRYHGRGGYVVLPPSRTGAGHAGWLREPRPAADGGAPWLPDIAVIVDTLVEAGVRAPDGSRLAY